MCGLGSGRVVVVVVVVVVVTPRTRDDDDDDDDDDDVRHSHGLMLGRRLERGDAPPFDAQTIARDCVVPSDQLALLRRIEEHQNSTNTDTVGKGLAPIDDTPEEYGTSQMTMMTATATAVAAAAAAAATTTSRLEGQRALKMEDDDDDDESEEEEDTFGGGGLKAKMDEEAYLVRPADGVKPLVLAREDAAALAAHRRVKKPVIVYDDDDEDDESEEVIPTQGEPPKSPQIGLLGRAVNAAAEALGFSSPFKSPVIAGGRYQTTMASPSGASAAMQSPNLPRALVLSPRTMANVVGSVARSVLDDEDARDIDNARVEWAARDGYTARAGVGAKRPLDFDDDSGAFDDNVPSSMSKKRLHPTTS